MPRKTKDLDVDLSPRQLADRYDFDMLHARHDLYIRVADVKARHYYSGSEIARLYAKADLYQQAIDYKEAEGQ